MDIYNIIFIEPWFCIILDINQGWKTKLEIEETLSRKMTIVIVNYLNLSIYCKFCFEVDYRIRDCLHQKEAHLNKNSNTIHNDSKKQI